MTSFVVTRCIEYLQDNRMNAATTNKNALKPSMTGNFGEKWGCSVRIALGYHIGQQVEYFFELQMVDRAHRHHRDP